MSFSLSIIFQIRNLFVYILLCLYIFCLSTSLSFYLCNFLSSIFFSASDTCIDIDNDNWAPHLSTIEMFHLKMRGHFPLKTLLPKIEIHQAWNCPCLELNQSKSESQQTKKTLKVNFAQIATWSTIILLHHGKLAMLNLIWAMQWPQPAISYLRANRNK